MMTIVRHAFGPEGVAYLRVYLDRNEGFGKRLGHLLSVRDLESGTTSAFVPASSSPEAFGDFERGGLFSRASDSASADTSAFQTWLGDRLRNLPPSTRLVCVEDALSRSTDLASQAPGGDPRFFCGDAVYRYARTPEDAIRIVKPGATWTPDIALVTTLPDGLRELRSGQRVNDEVVSAMADAAIAVVVGAWDAEGLLIWEPAAPTAEISTAR